MNVVHITTEISPTNTAYNEFARYRALYIDNSNDVLVSFKENNDDYYSRRLKIIGCRSNYLQYVKNVKSLMQRYTKKKSDLIIHHHFLKLSLLVLLLKPFNRSVKNVLTVHTTYQNYSFYNKLLIRLLLPFFDKVIFCGDESFKAVSRYKYFRRFEYKYSIVKNGVDIQRVDNVPKTQTSKNNNYKITTISKNQASKNIPFIIDVFKSLSSKYELHIIGEMRSSDIQLIKNSGCENRIIKYGQVDRDDLYSKIKGSNLFVSASLWEGLPIAVLEAAICGVPVILSDISPHLELKNDVEELIIKPLNQDKWCSKIDELSMLSTTEIESIVNSNRSDIEKKYSLQTMHENYTKVYCELMQEKRI